MGGTWSLKHQFEVLYRHVFMFCSRTKIYKSARVWPGRLKWTLWPGQVSPSLKMYNVCCDLTQLSSWWFLRSGYLHDSWCFYDSKTLLNNSMSWLSDSMVWLRDSMTWLNDSIPSWRLVDSMILLNNSITWLTWAHGGFPGPGTSTGGSRSRGAGLSWCPPEQIKIYI